MASKTAGSGGTDQTTTVESGTVHLIRLSQALEANATRNPTGINNVISTTSEDSRSLSATVNLPCNLTVNGDSTGYQIQAIDYFTQPSGEPAAYTAGSGGTFRGTTVQQALMQHIIAQRILELNSTKNPTGASYISYQINSSASIGNGNAIFSATISNVPLEITNNPNGEQVTSGKAYLL